MDSESQGPRAAKALSLMKKRNVTLRDMRTRHLLEANQMPSKRQRSIGLKRVAKKSETDIAPPGSPTSKLSATSIDTQTFRKLLDLITGLEQKSIGTPRELRRVGIPNVEASNLMYALLRDRTAPVMETSSLSERELQERIQSLNKHGKKASAGSLPWPSR
jgi:hypothetical protein